VVELEPRDIQVTVRTHGTIEARTEIDLVAEVPGRVSRVSPALAPGGLFKEGEVLLELDPLDAELARERAAAARARAGSEASLADLRLERMRTLADREISSRVELEQAEHESRIAAARLREARAALAQTTYDLERTRIRAPFNARVRTKRVDVGQFVTKGMPVARIFSVDAVEVRLPIPTAELAYLDLPGGRTDSWAAPIVHLRAEFAGTPMTWTGRIVRTEGTIADRSRMLNVVARVENPGRGPRDSVQPPLTVGLFVEAEIVGRTFENVFILPRSALHGPSRVLVADSEDYLRAREVQVLRVEGERVLVSSGLEPGERVSASASPPISSCC
jgi:RND family efflux transporter MFP subunit